MAQQKKRKIRPDQVKDLVQEVRKPQPRKWKATPAQMQFLRATEDEVLYGGAAGGGKALALDTPLPSPSGWMTMGEVQPGDWLLDERGEPCRVLAVSEVMAGRPCYEVVFLDGSTIIADADHCWVTFDVSERQAIAPSHTGTLRTTRDLARSVEMRGFVNHAIRRLDAEGNVLYWHYIVDVRPVASVSVKCAAVDSPSRLYLAGRSMIPTHNSDALLMFAILRRQTIPQSRGLILRRTFPELERSLIFRSMDLLKGVAKWQEQKKRWVFPNGSVLEFGYCETDADVFKYQSAEYEDICVAEGTPIAMADGASKPIEQVNVGDMVLTLEGPRPVVKKFPGRKAKCVEAQTLAGKQVHPTDHPVLTLYGWLSYDDICGALRLCETSGATQNRSVGISAQPSCGISRGFSQNPLFLRNHQGLHGEQAPLLRDHAGWLGICVLSEGGRSDCEESGGEHPIDQQLPLLSVPAVLHAQSVRRAGPGSVRRLLGALLGAQTRNPLIRGSQGRCSACCRLDDGRLQLRKDNDPVRLPSQACVAAQTLCDHKPDDRGCIHGHIPVKSFEYAHPYMMAGRKATEGVEVGPCVFTPLDGEFTVYDICVADVNHYISSSTGLLNRNCFDELTQFSEFQFTYLGSRLRTTKTGVRCLLRAATNPGNVGHNWVRARFIDPVPPNMTYVDPDAGLTRRFIPATLDDNPHIDRAQYELRLNALPEAERRALRYGDWTVFAGQYYREWQVDIHTCRPFEIPSYWKRFRSLDYGLDVTACYWWAVAPDGRHYIYRELYEPNLRLSQAAKRILEMTPDSEEIAYTVASPDLWNRRQDTGLSGFEVMTDAGLEGLQPADHRRVPGWRTLREYLAPYEDEQGVLTARLVVFDTCRNLIRALPTLIHDERNPEDVSDRCEDHGPEAVRYGVMSRPPLTKDLEKPKPLIRRHKEQLARRIRGLRKRFHV